MNKKDNQKMNMYAAVLQTCRAQQSAWEQIPTFVNAVNALENKLNELHHTHVEQVKATIGALGSSAGKKALREELTVRLYVISKALSLKGLITKDHNLQISYKTSASGWKSLPGNALMHKTEQMMLDLEIHGESLIEYGVAAEYISETQALFASMNTVLFEPRVAIVNKKQLTQKVKEQRQGIDQLLKEQLDILILPFKSSLPVFFNKYRGARVIIDSNHGTKTPPEPDDGSSEVQ